MGISTLAEKVKAILEDAFHPATVGLSTRDALVVWVVSERFEAMDDLERQEAVWDQFERALTVEERRDVSIVVALTPKERAFHTAGSL